MKNFNRLALTLAISVGGSGVVHASELGEKLPAVENEYSNANQQIIGNIALSDSMGDLNQMESKETLQNINLQVADVSELATPVEPATRIGNQIQLSEPPPPTPEPIPNPIPNFYNWVNLAQCESGGDWTINTGNGYYGGLQFALSSWESVGGLLFAERPDLATPEEQMLIAENLLDVQGWGAWPACSRKLGLR